MRAHTPFIKLLALSMSALHMLSLEIAHAADPITVPLRVTTGSDSSPLSGGQTDSPTSGDLRYCINYILNDQAQVADYSNFSNYTITFDQGIDSIQLANKLSIVNLLGPSGITIGNDDQTVTIIGDSGTSGLFIRQGAVTLKNLTFQNCNATGGNGGAGGGGGMGAGGALFIDSADVTLMNVNFDSCSATAGLGQPGSSGGGGGLGGSGGSPEGGGGGYSGNGGNTKGGGGGAGGDGGGNLGGGGGAILGANGGSYPTEAPPVTPTAFGSSPPSPDAFVVGGGGYGSSGHSVGGSGGGLGGGGGQDGTNSVGGSGGAGGAPQSNTGVGGAGNSEIMTKADDGIMGLLLGGGGGGGTFNNNPNGSGGGGGGGYSGGGGGGGTSTNGNGGGGGGGLGGGGGGGWGGSGGSGASRSGSGGEGSYGGAGGGGGPGGGGGGGGDGPNGLGHGGGGGAGGGGGGSYGGGSGGYGSGGGNGGPGGFGGGGGFSSYGSFGGGGGSDALGGFGGGGGSGGQLGGVGGTAGTGGVNDPSYGGGDGAALGGAVFFAGADGTRTLTLTGNCLTSGSGTSNQGGGGFSGGEDFFLSSNTTLKLSPGAGNTISITQSIIDDSVYSIPTGSGWTAGSGTGASLQVSGPGTVILGGMNTYIGPTTVSLGGMLKLANSTLYMGGAGPDSQVAIDQDSTLTGTGTIHAPLTISGTLVSEIAPGTDNNSQISATSTLTFDNGGAIQIDAPNPGPYEEGTTYTLVTDYTTLTGIPLLRMPSGLFGELSYPNNSILLTLIKAPLLELGLAGLTENSLTLANYLNTLSDAVLGSPFIDLAGLSNNDQASALLTLSPSRAAFARYGNAQAAFSFSRLVSGRLFNARTFRETSNPSLISLGGHAINEKELLAAAGEGTHAHYGSPKQSDDPKPYTVWMSGFGGRLSEKAAHQNPSFHVINTGLLTAVDKRLTDDAMVGGGLAYANSQIHEANHLGKAQTRGGFATLYGTWFLSDVFLDASLWGGYLHTENHRNIFYPGFSQTATCHYNSIEANGHLELGYDWDRGQGAFEPFIACDYVGNWQGRYSEEGAAPYNMHIPSHFASLLQTELGVNGYYSRDFLSNWTLILRGKASYVNQVPFYQNRVQANIIGSTGSVSLLTSLKTQNLFSPAFELYWKYRGGGFFSLLYTGQFGKGFQNNELNAKVGLSF